MTDSTPDPADRYRVLPEPVRLVDTVALVDTTTAPDPQMGRDTETEFLLRNAG
ncbi:heme biosynthesis protein HemY [Cellulomonas edaphi]|uniref:Heme biosynthesis protein HemY n=1 Tax=Cellulomonas edaphi TaxID=3053468 RepID=A0ABT7S4F0_9CELL|nr:heme biosynthesis protein HemY [Cellulomons edaphi]MDM7830503.1 heme biosynthesis protein HemY [Cellulomons edaphi]